MMAAAVAITVALCRFSPRPPVLVAASLLPIGIATYRYTAYYLSKWIGVDGLLPEGIIRVLGREIVGDIFASGMMVAIVLCTFLMVARTLKKGTTYE